MRVKALTRGYYADRIVEPDQIFTLKDPKHFSPWMEKVDADEDTGEVKKVSKSKAAAKPKVDFAG